MRTPPRFPAGVLALGAVAALLACPAVASAAPADDSVMVNNINTTPGDISVFPQGSTLVGPVVVKIDTVIVDAGAVQVILDTVALLSQITAPFGVHG